jgi:hypothetical protein
MDKKEINNLKLNQDINQLLREIINKIDNPTDSWKNEYTGKVVDNGDPEKIGRCKIRVFGVFSDQIPDVDLPWAMPCFNFVGSKEGSFVVPPVGAIVKVTFDNGDIYLPKYSTKVVDTNNLPSERLTNYPDNMILFKSDNGDILEINRQTKDVTFTHNSGTTITMKSDKSFELKQSGSDSKMEIERNGTINLEQSRNGAKVEINRMGNINIQSGPLNAINIGGNRAILPCPDMQSCVITGAPLAIGTTIPGSQVNVP